MVLYDYLKIERIHTGMLQFNSYFFTHSDVYALDLAPKNLQALSNSTALRSPANLMPEFQLDVCAI